MKYYSFSAHIPWCVIRTAMYSFLLGGSNLKFRVRFRSQLKRALILAGISGSLMGKGVVSSLANDVTLSTIIYLAALQPKFWNKERENP
jgi:hypothetical protein